MVTIKEIRKDFEKDIVRTLKQVNKNQISISEGSEYLQLLIHQLINEKEVFNKNG